MTGTRRPVEGEMVMDAETGYRLLCFRRWDGSSVKGVEIALSFIYTMAALSHYQAVPPWSAGLLSVAYAPTDQSGMEK